MSHSKFLPATDRIFSGSAGKHQTTDGHWRILKKNAPNEKA
jgi:hypothetical protein